MTIQAARMFKGIDWDKMVKKASTVHCILLANPQ